jgi:hypothetical protein
MKVFSIIIVALLILAGIIGWWMYRQAPPRPALDGDGNFPIIPQDEGYLEEDGGAVTIFQEPPPDYDVIDIPVPGLVYRVAVDDASPQFEAVATSTFLDVFWVNECTVLDNPIGRSIAITAKPNAALGRKQFQATEQAILNWESYIVRDIGVTLFPGLAPSVLSSVRTTFTTHDLDTRVTTFVIDGKEYKIYYGWVLNFVMFATSYECLATSIHAVYSPHAH